MLLLSLSCALDDRNNTKLGRVSSRNEVESGRRVRKKWGRSTYRARNGGLSLW